MMKMYEGNSRINWIWGRQGRVMQEDKRLLNAASEACANMVVE